MCGLHMFPLCQHEMIEIYVLSSMGLGPSGAFGFLWLLLLEFPELPVGKESERETTIGPGTRHFLCCSWCCCHRLWLFCPPGTLDPFAPFCLSELPHPGPLSSWTVESVQLYLLQACSLPGSFWTKPQYNLPPCSFSSMITCVRESLAKWTC